MHESWDALNNIFYSEYGVDKWQESDKGEFFLARSIGSSAVGGFLLVFIIVIGAYLNSSAALNFHAALKMFLSIYILEILYALLLAWPTWLLCGFLKYKENIDVYDHGVNYNPFSFK